LFAFEPLLLHEREQMLMYLNKY